MEFHFNPVDVSLNVAIRHLAGVMNPAGWHQKPTFEEVPTTYEGIVAYYEEHGRIVIAEEDSDGTIYDCADTNHHLRAWHDALHIRYKLAFDAAGEAAASYVHIAQITQLYGCGDRTRAWAALLLGDLLALVHYHNRTGLWPSDKRATCLKWAEEWRDEANALVDELSKVHESNRVTIALARAERKWGHPYAKS